MSRLDRVEADFAEYGDARLVPVDPELVRDLVAIAQAALDLYERVEMDESVGICLSSRGESMTLGNAFSIFEEPC